MKSKNKSNIFLNNGKEIGDDCKPYLIAEIGTNHNQDIKIAKDLIKEIALAGFDCAKFQTYESNEIVSELITAKDYQLDKLYGNISAIEMFDKFLKTPKDWFPELIDLCHKHGIDCATTIHGSHGIQWVKDLNFDLIKIASMDHNNFPFLEEIKNNVNQPILISFGMAEFIDIKKAIKILADHKLGLAAFHCVSIYPAKHKDLRLTNINYLKNNFSIPIGFSDHSEDIISSCLALKFGSSIFEKHVTLDRKLNGPDHPFALEPHQMKEYVDGIITLYKDINTKEFKSPSKEEVKNRTSYLKSIVAKKDLFIGDYIDTNDIQLVRPGTGIPPSQYKDVIGCKIKRNINKGNPIKWSDLDK